MNNRILILLIAFVAATSGQRELTKIGRLPALGWNSWNAYYCDINQDKVLAAANLTVKLGLRNAGYEYINMDDCWAAQDRVNGKLTHHSVRFKDGIASLASKVHAMGLKFGIYSDAGTHTCARTMPGSLGHEDVDAETFASWGVDYLKYDDCNVPEEWNDKCDFCMLPPNSTCSRKPQEKQICRPGEDGTRSNSSIRFARMSDALLKQKRPIFYSLCNQGKAGVQNWGAKTGHSWRATDDISPKWESVLDLLGRNAFNMHQVDFYGHSDADMLEVGNGLNLQQERSHFALWAAMKSPLLIGTDLARIKPESLEILKTKALLQFHQDQRIGRPAIPFRWNWTYDIKNPPRYWAGQYSGGTMVWLFNSNSHSDTMALPIKEIPGLPSAKSYTIIDAWKGKTGCITDVLEAKNIAAFDTVVYILKPSGAECKSEKMVLQDPVLGY